MTRQLVLLGSFVFVLIAAGCETTVNCGPTGVRVGDTCECPAGTMPLCDGRPCADGEISTECVPLDGGMGDTGGGDSGDDTGGDPCGGACEGEMPFCDSESGSCVQCLEASHCDADAPVCGDGGSCAACASPDDCTAYPDTPLCNDTGDGACVACVGHGDCTAADAARCDPTTNTCVPCDDSAQCTEDGEGVCDESGESGVCVECNADDESACGTNVCDVEAMTCTTTPAGETGLCQECVSDRQCSEGRVCVPMTYMDGDTEETFIGNFCLWREDASGGGGPDGNCAETRIRPYFRGAEVTTLSGETVRVCTLRATTCPGLNDYSAEPCDTPFDSDADCGAGLGDALCRNVSGPTNRCTIRCSSDDDCLSTTCNTGESPRYCNF